MVRSELITGADGVVRCGWVTSAPEYERYHDDEWGTPFRTERDMFEKVCLEGFQAGLSWITILRRRPAFRAAFDNFDPHTVAEFDPPRVEILMNDSGIIRNRAKIQSCVSNAQIVVEMLERGESLVDLVWSFAPRGQRTRPRTLAQLPAITSESEALSAELRRRGFRFVGATTMYALMQSEGLVDDHLVGCHRAS
ncbi:MAG: DNA-3-methyladenine glycosylase I [Microbacteriaceae bacterium]